MVDLVALAQAAQDADGVLDGRLGNQHRLEAALERGVLLDVFAVLVERRGANCMELATGEHRLQHVRGVDGALGRARADHRVQLVDEQDDLSARGGDLLQNRLEALLELPAVFGPRHQRAQVEGDDAFLLESFRHVLPHDALGKPLDDGCLANTRLAYQHGIVLGAPGEHLHQPADLFVAADHRIQRTRAGARRQIGTIPFQRFVLALRIGIGDPLRSAHGLQYLLNPVWHGLVAREDHGRRRAAALGGQRQQQVLGADVLVREPFGLGGRPLDDLSGPRGQGRRGAAPCGRKLRHRGASRAGNRCRIGP